MKKLLIICLCGALALGLAGCRKDKAPEATPPAGSGNVSQNPGGEIGGAGSSTNPDGTTAGTGDNTGGATSRDPKGPMEQMGQGLDRMGREMGHLWADMKAEVSAMTDLDQARHGEVFDSWGIDKDLLEDYSLKEYSDSKGGRMLLARVKAGKAADLASALRASGVEAQVWENGDYVLIADTDRAADIATRFKALNF